MRGELSRTTKSFQTELRLANWLFISYDSKLNTLILYKKVGFQYFIFPKTIRYELRDSRNVQGFALIFEQSCPTKNYLLALKISRSIQSFALIYGLLKFLVSSSASPLNSVYCCSNIL